MQQEMGFEEPRFAQWLFASPAAGLMWLVVRVYIGYEWLHAGWGKVTGTEGNIWTWDFAYTPESWLRTAAPLQGFTKYALSGRGAGTALRGQLRVVRLVPRVARPPGSRGGVRQGHRAR